MSVTPQSPQNSHHDTADSRPMGLHIDTHPPVRLEDDQAVSARVWLVVLIGIAIGLRLLVFFLGPGMKVEQAYHADSPRYIELAQHLADDYTFGLDDPTAGGVVYQVDALRAEAGQLESRTAAGLQPEVYRTPGYPAFLAALRWLGMSIYTVLIIQCVLGALCVMLIYRVTHSLLKSTSAALLAAAVFAVHPGAIAMTNTILPDVLWITLMLAGLWFIFSSEAQPTASMAIGGLLLGFAALVQPYSLLLVGAIGLWVLLHHRRLAMIGPVVVMLVMTVLPPGAWMTRNHLQGFGVRISSEPSIDRYFHTLADMRINEAGGDRNKDWPQTAESLITELQTKRGENEDVFAAMDRLTYEAMQNQPALYAQTLQRDAVHLATDHSLAMLYQQLGLTYASPDVQEHILTSGFSLHNWTGTSDDATLAVAGMWTLFNALLAIASLVGLVLMCVRRKWMPAILLVGLLGYMLVDQHNASYERLHVLALGFQAALIAGIALPHPKPKHVKAKKTRAQKRAEKLKQRQEQVLGDSRNVDQLTRDDDPIIPGSGTRQSARPI